MSGACVAATGAGFGIIPPCLVQPALKPSQVVRPRDTATVALCSWGFSQGHATHAGPSGSRRRQFRLRPLAPHRADNRVRVGTDRALPRAWRQHGGEPAHAFRRRDHRVHGNAGTGAAGGGGAGGRARPELGGQRDHQRPLRLLGGRGRDVRDPGVRDRGHHRARWGHRTARLSSLTGAGSRSPSHLVGTKPRMSVISPVRFFASLNCGRTVIPGTACFGGTSSRWTSPPSMPSKRRRPQTWGSGNSLPSSSMRARLTAATVAFPGALPHLRIWLRQCSQYIRGGKNVLSQEVHTAVTRVRSFFTALRSFSPPIPAV